MDPSTSNNSVSVSDERVVVEAVKKPTGRPPRGPRQTNASASDADSRTSRTDASSVASSSQTLDAEGSAVRRSNRAVKKPEFYCASRESTAKKDSQDQQKQRDVRSKKETKKKSPAESARGRRQRSESRGRAEGVAAKKSRPADSSGSSAPPESGNEAENGSVTSGSGFDDDLFQLITPAPKKRKTKKNGTVSRSSIAMANSSARPNPVLLVAAAEGNDGAAATATATPSAKSLQGRRSGWTVSRLSRATTASESEEPQLNIVASDAGEHAENRAEESTVTVDNSQPGEIGEDDENELADNEDSDSGDSTAAVAGDEEAAEEESEDENPTIEYQWHSCAII